MAQGGPDVRSRARAQTLLRQAMDRYSKKMSARSSRVLPGGLMIEYPMDSEMIDDL